MVQLYVGKHCGNKANPGHCDADLVGSPGWIVVAEELCVHFINGREVVDVRQQYRGLHHVVEGTVGSREDVTCGRRVSMSCTVVQLVNRPMLVRACWASGTTPPLMTSMVSGTNPIWPEMYSVLFT